MTSSGQTAMVVYESMFGDTAAVAEAIATGLGLDGFDCRAQDVADAPAGGHVGADLLVVGAPTHTFSLSRPQTRHAAIEQGAPVERERIGIREWLGTLAPAWRTDRPLVATFDTRHQRTRHLPVSAARSAARQLSRRGYTLLARPQGFVVSDVKGPLLPGELERAVEWGRTIARLAQDRMAADSVAAAHRSR